MSVLIKLPEPNIWEDICREFASKRPPFPSAEKPDAGIWQDFNPAYHNPVFYGKMHAKVDVDDDNVAELDAAISHPSISGYALVDRCATPPPPSPQPPPDPKTCLPREYLEHYIFPVLLPALEEMLREAKTEKCFERKRTKFNPMDFLTEYLYKNNPQFNDRNEMGLLDINFVQEWLKDHPRPPLPLSLIWTEEEATLVLQSHWRGYLVRREPEIQDLRIWQREWREINADPKEKVDEFWAEKMPDGDAPEEEVEQEQDQEQQQTETETTQEVELEKPEVEPSEDTNTEEEPKS